MTVSLVPHSRQPACQDWWSATLVEAKRGHGWHRPPGAGSNPVRALPTYLAPRDEGGCIHLGVVTLAEGHLAAAGREEFELVVAEAGGEALAHLVVVCLLGLGVIDFHPHGGGAALLAHFLGGEEGAAAGLAGIAPVAVEVDLHAVEIPVLGFANGVAAAGGEAVADEVVAGGHLPALGAPVDDDLGEVAEHVVDGGCGGAEARLDLGDDVGLGLGAAVHGLGGDGIARGGGARDVLECIAHGGEVGGWWCFRFGALLGRGRLVRSIGDEAGVAWLQIVARIAPAQVWIVPGEWLPGEWIERVP